MATTTKDGSRRQICAPYKFFFCELLIAQGAAFLASFYDLPGARGKR